MKTHHMLLIRAVSAIWCVDRVFDFAEETYKYLQDDVMQEIPTVSGMRGLIVWGGGSKAEKY